VYVICIILLIVETRCNLVKIRGLNDDVNKAFKSLAKLAKKLDEANCVLEIPIFKQFHKLVVGKGGANIKKVLFCYSNLICLNITVK